jgi:hypothetical protein
MPTTNWILEAALDRYLEATDPPVPAVARDFELTCPFCQRSFVSADAHAVSESLARHIARNHPLLRPVLVIAGKMLGPNSVVTRMAEPSDVVIENATAIELAIDGGSWTDVSTEETARIIAERPRRMLNVRLINSRVQDGTAASVDYRIKIDVANETELAAVDEAFLRHLARDDTGREDIMRFSNETDGLANFYRDGLASYVLGVFAKDDTTVSEDPHVLERALAAFGRAAFHLHDFTDRRIAAAVAACACLNLNDLSHAGVSTGVTSVDAASKFLRALSLTTTPPTWPTQPAGLASDIRCPVDEATFAFLELLFWLSEAEPNGWVGHELERIEHGSLTAPDRAKFAVVLGEWADRRGLGDITGRCAPILYNDPIFETAVNRWGTP